jgi:medium-chain acyl-[acyl-carrier-protein] hydrolase
VPHASPPPPSSPWLVSFESDPDADVRLFCFAHAGAGAVVFHPWSRALRPHVVVHAAQLPGREIRFHETPVRVLGEIVEPITRAITALADRPFVLFGHSLGAHLAFEVARRLQQEGRVNLSTLIVSGRPAPHLPSRTPMLAHLPAREVVFRIAELYGGIPAALLEEPAIVGMMGRVLQADLEALEHHEHVAGPRLVCPIVAISGRDDPSLSHAELDAWREYTQSDFACTQFAGDHFYFKSAESQPSVLALVLQRCLAAATGPAGDTTR